MDTSEISVRNAVRFSWEEFKKDRWFFVGTTAVLLVFSIVVDGLTSDGHGASGAVGVLISLLASTVVTIAFARLALSTVVGAHVGWDGLWAPEYFLRMLGATVLQTVVVLVGFILLVVPGIIASLLLCFTQLAVVDKKLMPLEALKESYRLTRPHLRTIFWLTLTVAGMNIAGLLVLGIGLLVSIPVSLIAIAYVYKKLANAQEPMVVQSPSA